MKGAGGTEGGVVKFLLGLLMMGVGGYLLLNAIQVTSSFGFGSRLYSVNALGGSYGMTSGMIMVPFMIGVGVIFYDYKKWLGWLLAVGSLVALIVGVIASIRFSFRSMSSFDLIVILVLFVGGMGLFLNSLKSARVDSKKGEANG
ncbi:MAG: hypothetical protein RSD49_06705 [Hafnia sp.]